MENYILGTATTCSLWRGGKVDPRGWKVPGEQGRFHTASATVLELLDPFRLSRTCSGSRMFDSAAGDQQDVASGGGGLLKPRET